jgi:CBS domain-containing protein
MQQKDIHRLPIVDNKEKMLGIIIITDKDIFRTILKSQSLVSSFVSDQILVDQQSYTAGLLTTGSGTFYIHT